MMKLGDVITINPNLVSGTPVFKGTRIPLGHLFTYLLEGKSVDDFVGDYEIDRAKIIAFLEYLEETYAEPNTTKADIVHEGAA